VNDIIDPCCHQMLEKTGRRILKVGDFDQTGELAALTAKNPTLSGPSEATTILTQGASLCDFPASDGGSEQFQRGNCGKCFATIIRENVEMGRVVLASGRKLQRSNMQHSFPPCYSQIVIRLQIKPEFRRYPEI